MLKLKTKRRARKCEFNATSNEGALETLGQIIEDLKNGVKFYDLTALCDEFDEPIRYERARPEWLLKVLAEGLYERSLD